MTQVYKTTPLFWGAAVTPKKKLRSPARGFSDKRKGQGPKMKLSERDVLAMRLAGEWGWKAALVGRLFSVTSGAARMVMLGYTHAHVREE